VVVSILHRLGIDHICDKIPAMRSTSWPSWTRRIGMRWPQLCGLWQTRSPGKYEEILARWDLHLETVWRAIEPALSPG
jgi:hypothetical protein